MTKITLRISVEETETSIGNDFPFFSKYVVVVKWLNIFIIFIALIPEKELIY